jgi:hypothetical protein
LSPRIYQPHEEVTDGDVSLYRRVPPGKRDFYSDKKQRATSFNFVPDSVEDDLSMHLGDRTTPEEILQRYPDAGLLEIKAGVLRAAGLRITFEPDEGPDHVSVWGLKGSTEGQRKALSRQIIKSWKPRY